MPTTRSIKFYSYDLMPCGAVKVSSVLKQFQQTAREDTDSMGMTYEKMREMGIVFVLSKLKLILDKPIFSYDDIEIQTWQRMIKGATFIRDFRIIRKGEIIGRACSYWVLIDFNTRKICRPSALGMECENVDVGDHADPERLIGAPCEYESVDERKVRFSDTDQNRHLNNTVYADIATDCIDYFDKNEYVNEIQINFEGETVPGETIGLERAFCDGYYYIKGSVADRKCFEAKLSFKEL